MSDRSRSGPLPVLVPVLAGVLFSVGLAVSGMTQPAKVVGFLNFSDWGAWDPSLAFVMVGAIGVYAAVFRVVNVRRGSPLLAAKFSLPATSRIDSSLVGGAALFGVGWGLSGFCPGPALVSLGAGAWSALWFVPATLVGMALFQGLRRAPAAPAAPAVCDG